MENLTALERRLNEDCLRKALYSLSASPESFFAIRNNFGRSLATLCIANWILGIGDRHTGNILVDKKTGELIGIDFNMAFGAATRKLSIPEMVPFRLTPQLVNALSPLGTSGLLTKCMGHTLRRFTIKKISLLATLAIFINEPTIDWMEEMDRSTSSSQETSQSRGSLWIPQQRIGAVHDKLKGINPKVLIEKELKSGVFSV